MNEETYCEETLCCLLVGGRQQALSMFTWRSSGCLLFRSEDLAAKLFNHVNHERRTQINIVCSTFIWKGAANIMAIDPFRMVMHKCIYEGGMSGIAMRTLNIHVIEMRFAVKIYSTSTSIYNA